MFKLHFIPPSFCDSNVTNKIVTLKKYNSSASFYNGVKVIEQDGFVYIFSNYNTQINGYYAYKYQGDTYIETIQTKYQNLNSNNTTVSPAEEKLYIDQEKTKYALKDSNVIYNADGSVFGTIPKVGLSSDYAYNEPVVWDVINGKIIFEAKTGHDYKGWYDINNLEYPVIYAEFYEQKYFKFEDFYIFRIYEDFSYFDEGYQYFLIRN